jgi:predicted NBD/HSP70 family sugar kinase
MIDPVHPNLTYYLVRVPHLVLTHGEQLQLNAAGDGAGFNQTKMWTVGRASRAHAAEAVARLRKDGYLASTRPLRLGPETGVVLGVSLGRESLRAAVIDANGAVRARAEAKPVESRLRRQTPNETLDDIANVANDALAEAITESAAAEQDPAHGETLFVKRRVGEGDRSALPLLGVAVAWPTPIHRYNKHPTGGKPTLASLHDRWWGKDLRKLVADRLGLEQNKVSAVNDANAAAIATVFDKIRATYEPTAKRDTSDKDLPEYQPTNIALTVRIGGGVGAGTVAVGAYSPTHFSAFNDAALIETESGLAGEVGHLVVNSGLLERINAHRGELPELVADAKCDCGEPGHLEAYASATAFVQRLARLEDDVLGELGLSKDDSRGNASIMHDVIARIEQEGAHPTVERALQDMGLLLGNALAGTVLMLSPSSITLAGSAACEPLSKGFTAGLNGAGAFFGSDDIPITSTTGIRNRYSSARGAALCVFRSLIYRQLDEFSRLYTRAGERKLDDSDRLFSHHMRLIGAGALPLGIRKARRRVSEPS